MNILSILDISQSLSNRQRQHRHKFVFLLGEFITLTVSHDCFIEMKPKVALQLAGSSEL